MVVAILHDYLEKIKSLWDRQAPAPHKPFLLLSIIELIAHGHIYENKIILSDELKATFEKYMSLRPDRIPSINNPFFHLKTNGFWHLYPQELNNRSTRSAPSMRAPGVYGYLDDQLFLLLANSEHREIIRQEIIDWYFTELRTDIENLIETSQRITSEQIEADVDQYSEALIAGAARPFSPRQAVASIQVETPVRSAGFRRAIMMIYDWTCAVCELNIRALRGERVSESVTDAAHIIPFSVSHNDDVRNGISLCKSHHWAFDTGLVSISETYQVIVSPSISERGPTGQMLTGLWDGEIWLPGEPERRPAPEALTWHREQVMRQ